MCRLQDCFKGTFELNGYLVDVFSVGFLQSDDGYILKPVLGPAKGLREVEFYRKVHDPDCTDDVLLGLRQFVPGYVGVWNTPEHPGRRLLLPFLVLIFN